MTHQCPRKLEAYLFEDGVKLRAELASVKAELAATQAAHALEQALRARVENKLAKAMPRRINRDREED